MKSNKLPKKKKKKNSSFPNFLTILGIFFVMLSGSLIATYVISHQKRYDPALENKLEVKTIPSDVKKTLKYATPSANFRVPVLMYHYVEYVQDKKDTIRQSLDTTPFTLENQIIALKNAGYTFMTASQLGKVLNGEMQMPKNPILLTFDDGHRDFYTDAFPILEKYNVPATEFIITGFLGGSDFMDPDQVAQIAKSGLIEIGAHTVDHISLKGKTPSVLQKEIEGSKITLQADYHVAVVSFAYPYGSFDQNAINAVKSAGFTTAVSTLPGIEVNQSDRYFIERIRPGGRIGSNLIDFLKNYQQPLQTSTTPKD